MSHNVRRAKRIQELFHFYRGCILDACEQEIDDPKKWDYLRGRMLKLLSPERGLECKILELVLEDEDDQL